MTALNNTGTAIASIGNTAVYVAYQDIAAAGSTGTKSWATASFSRGITFSHALRPEISNLPRLGVARTRT
jgi:hypothetical protein